MDDKEYAVSYYKDGILDEIGLHDVTTLAQAISIAEDIAGKGATQVTIKYYEDGDLRHQWDLKGVSWVQYE